MRKIVLGLLAALAILSPVAASAQVCPAVAALPDSERRVSYSPSASTGPFSVTFAILGDSTDAGNWLEVWLDGTRLTYTTDWTFSLSSGASVATACRPITNGQVTLVASSTGTLQIVGARRPRRTSQFAENRGVPARDLNQVVTDLTAQLRETWDKTNDVTGRSIIGLPGETITPLPSATSRAGKFFIFDGSGNPTVTAPTLGTGNVLGPGSSTVNNFARWNNTTGTLLKDGGATIATADIANNATTNAKLAQAAAATTKCNPTTATANLQDCRSAFLSARDFGAVGDNSTDDTTALQAWINACQSLSRVCFLDAGNYKTTAALNITAGISIIGPSNSLAQLRPASTTLDTIAINTTAGVLLENFQIQGPSSGGLGTSTAGALISITAPSTNFNIHSTFRDLYLVFGWNAINFVQASNWSVDSLFIQATVNNGIQIANLGAGDSGDQFISNSTLSGQNAGIAIAQTSAGGLKMINNKIIAWAKGYDVTLSSSISTSQLNIANNNFDSNATSISLNKGTGTVFGTIMITGNLIGGPTGYGITDDANAGWLSNLVVTGNYFAQGVSSTGIRLQNMTEFVISGNLFVGSGGTPTGINIGSGSSNGLIANNRLDNLTTKITNASTSTVIVDNPSYNPVGVTAAATMGASPTTVTAGASPETHYVRQSATNTATIAKGGQQIATLAGATTYYTIQLGPYESYVTTWVTTAPTYTKDVH